jgi:hypothetical protein
LFDKIYSEAFQEPVRSGITALGTIFQDVHNLVLKDEEIGLVLSREPDHVAIIIFDPTAYDLAIGEFHAHRFLLVAEPF